MTDNHSQPHAGCVGTQDTDAGCVQGLGETGQASAPPPADGDSAGSASPATDSKGPTPAKPPQTVREFEHALRALGFSRPQAQAIARKGFSGATAIAEPEPEPAPSEPDQLRTALQRLAQTLKVEP